jgi:hypothetical protein
LHKPEKDSDIPVKTELQFSDAKDKSGSGILMDDWYCFIKVFKRLLRDFMLDTT